MSVLALRRVRRSLVAASAFISVAAHAQGAFVRPVPITDFDVRHAVTGATVLPPRESGWLLVAKRADGVVFVRRGDRADHTHSASVLVSVLDRPIESRSSLAAEVRIGPENTDTKRYKLVSSDVAEDDVRPELCVRRRIQVEDYKAVQRSATGVLVMTSVDLICRHPAHDRLVITIHMSERDQPDGTAAGLDERARNFQTSVRFEPLPPEAGAK